MSEPACQAIVDIGSNSVRLVIFGGPPRAPVVLHNEKIMAGLGRGVVAGGRLDPENVALALDGLARFATLVEIARPQVLRVVATAAVREAADGADFVAQVRDLGLPCDVLDGDQEATGSAYGVISALPGADGLMADMGGGSLELARIADGAVHERTSLKLGAMRVAQIRAGGDGKLRKMVRAALADFPWLERCAGKPIYLVGGSWRSLARVHMDLHDYPLPVLGNYSFPAGDAKALKAAVKGRDPADLAALPGVKTSRSGLLDDAAALLATLVALTRPDRIVISDFGLREGLIFQQLDPAARRRDPLIEGMRHAVGPQQQARDYPELLLAWTDPLFPGEADELRRLRHAACLLRGTGWASNPAFRAAEGEEYALHGSWVGVDGTDRATMAMALHVGMGGDPETAPPLLARLAPAERLERACRWGLAIRLAQRLGGGSPVALELTRLAMADGQIVLTVPRRLATLIDGGVERRMARLGLALDRDARIETTA